MTDFGQRLRGARMHAALTQRELADLAGVTRAMISLYERGKQAPSMNTLARVAKALGVKPGHLLTGRTRRIGQ